MNLRHRTLVVCTFFQLFTSGERVVMNDVEDGDKSSGDEEITASNQHKLHTIARDTDFDQVHGMVQQHTQASISFAIEEHARLFFNESHQREMRTRAVAEMNDDVTRAAYFYSLHHHLSTLQLDGECRVGVGVTMEADIGTLIAFSFRYSFIRPTNLLKCAAEALKEEAIKEATEVGQKLTDAGKQMVRERMNRGNSQTSPSSSASIKKSSTFAKLQAKLSDLWARAAEFISVNCSVSGVAGLTSGFPFIKVQISITVNAEVSADINMAFLREKFHEDKKCTNARLTTNRPTDHLPEFGSPRELLRPGRMDPPSYFKSPNSVTLVFGRMLPLTRGIRGNLPFCKYGYVHKVLLNFESPDQGNLVKVTLQYGRASAKFHKKGRKNPAHVMNRPKQQVASVSAGEDALCFHLSSREKICFKGCAYKEQWKAVIDRLMHIHVTDRNDPNCICEDFTNAWSLHVGWPVQAKYAADNIWYDATIMNINTDGTFTVEWIDGDDVDNIKMKNQIRAMPHSTSMREAKASTTNVASSQQGWPVEALHEGNWMGASIMSVRDNGLFSVRLRLTEGLRTVDKTIFDLRPLPQVGWPVEARRTTDRKWYDAKIMEVHRDGTFTIEWANGNREDLRKRRQDIRDVEGVELEETILDRAARREEEAQAYGAVHEPVLGQAILVFSETAAEHGDGWVEATIDGVNEGAFHVSYTVRGEIRERAITDDEAPESSRQLRLDKGRTPSRIEHFMDTYGQDWSRHWTTASLVMDQRCDECAQSSQALEDEVLTSEVNVPQQRSAQECPDDSTWKSESGIGCDVYRMNEYCSVHGYGPGWEDDWGGFETDAPCEGQTWFGNGACAGKKRLKSAAEACCGCQPVENIECLSDTKVECTFFFTSVFGDDIAHTSCDGGTFHCETGYCALTTLTSRPVCVKQWVPRRGSAH